MKFDGANGAVLWTATLGGDDTYEVALSVAIAPDGNPVATGYTCGSDPCRAWVIKFDGANGTHLWTATDDALTQGLAVAIGNDGHPVATIILPDSGSPSRTVKYDGLTGAVLWDVSFNDGTGWAVAVGPDGNPVVAGAACAPTTDCDVLDFRTVKYAGATGAELWSVAFSNDEFHEVGAFAVAVGSDGHPVVVGNSCDPNDEGGASCGLRTVKYDGATGGLLWTVLFDVAEGNNHSPLSAAIGPDGDPVVNALTCIGVACNVTTFKYLLQYDTPVGAFVGVALNGGTSAAGGVSVTYSAVVIGGSTTLTGSATGPTPPAGFSLGEPPLFYDIATAATVIGSIQVCLNYTDRPVPAPEADLKLLHFEGGTWVDVTTSLDTVNNVICGQADSLSPFVIARTAGNPLSSLGPANIWVGLKNSDDAGIRFDLRAEVYRNGTQLVGSGDAASVPGGRSGFNNARQDTIVLTPVPGVTFAPGDTLSITLRVRNACSGSGKNSGTARLWFNDSAANSRFDATLGAPATYFLRHGFALATTPGSGPKTTIDVAAGAKCSAFKTFGTWTTTLP